MISRVNDGVARAAAELGLRRARAEIELLAAWAGGLRQGRWVMEQAGVDSECFIAHDTGAIAFVFWVAGDRTNGLKPWSRETLLRGCIRTLTAVNSWDPESKVECAGGSRWSFGALFRLLTCCEFNIEVMRRCIDRLQQIRQQQIALARGLEAA